MFVILFFVLFIGQVSMQLVADNIYLDFLKIYFLDVCFFSKFANIIASVRTGQLNQLHEIHLRTRLVCSEIIYTSFEKVRDIFFQDVQRFMYWKSGKIEEENIKATEK